LLLCAARTCRNHFIRHCRLRTGVLPLRFSAPLAVGPFLAKMAFWRSAAAMTLALVRGMIQRVWCYAGVLKYAGTIERQRVFILKQAQTKPLLTWHRDLRACAQCRRTRRQQHSL
jgi:hypothetical protein